MPIFNLLSVQLSEPHSLSITSCQLIWKASYSHTLVLNGSQSFPGRSRYPANPQQQKVLFTQARACGPSRGVAAALACKYVNNTFYCVDCLFLPILLVKRRESRLSPWKPHRKGSVRYIITYEPYTFTGGIRCMIII